MAKLEIELSEYDAMREARKAAEARVEELKQENKDLKGQATDENLSKISSEYITGKLIKF